MKLLAYLGIQVRQYIWRWRWLLPIPVMLFIAYRSDNAVKSLLELYAGASANLWDVFFIAFGNGWNIFLIVTNLFLFLVCDLLPESGFGQLALLRLGSRGSWWLAKCLTLLVAVLAYAALAAGCVVVYAALNFPLGFSWSTLAQRAPEALNIPFVTPRNAAAPAVIGQILLLLILGWYGLGLLMMVVTQLSRRFLIGYLGGLVALFASCAVAWISNPPPWTRLFIFKHLMFNHFPLPFRDVAVSLSVVYWAAWLAVLLAAGYALSRRQDYFALRH